MAETEAEVKVIPSPRARDLLDSIGLTTTDDIETLAREYLKRLRIADAVESVTIWVHEWTKSDPGGCIDLGDDTDVHMYIHKYWTRDDFRSVLMHELAHLQRWVRGLTFEIPDLASGWSDVSYYAASRSEMEALAWEVTVNRARFITLRRAMAMRLQK